MHIFYSDRFDGSSFILDPVESQHLSKVLRLKKGMEVQIINGNGILFSCLITDDNHRMARAEVVSEAQGADLRNYSLHLGIAPTKSSDRFDWFIEKSVEIGIDQITPLLCDHSERKRINMERSDRIVISAMKQSRKTMRTRINEPIPFKDFISSRQGGNRYIAWCDDDNRGFSLNSCYNKGEDALILIGPEGDFSPGEVSLAIEKGFVSVTLGQSRLRTETAGVAACCWIYFMNQ